MAEEKLTLAHIRFGDDGGSIKNTNKHLINSNWRGGRSKVVADSAVPKSIMTFLPYDLARLSGEPGLFLFDCPTLNSDFTPLPPFPGIPSIRATWR
jgi:hypothetical protein